MYLVYFNTIRRLLFPKKSGRIVAKSPQVQGGWSGNEKGK
jgi:hypothetical protein